MGYFTNLLVHRAVWKITDGTDSNNRVKVVEEKEVACRIEFGTSMIAGGIGQELTVSGRVFLDETPKNGDLIEIEEKDRLIVKVTPSFALDGVKVINEIYFQ